MKTDRSANSELELLGYDMLGLLTHHFGQT